MSETEIARDTNRTEFNSDSRETWLFLSMSRPSPGHQEHDLAVSNKTQSPEMSVERQNLTIETELHSDSRETWLFLSMSRPSLNMENTF